jgi:hypothetical protein
MKLHTKILMSICILFLMFISQNKGFAQEVSGNGLEKANPAQLNTMIEELPKEAEKIGLTQNKIQANCELKFRQHGIEPTDTTSRNTYLYVECNTVGNAFHIELQFERPIEFIAEKKIFVMTGTTWTRGITGLHGGKSEYVTQMLNQLLDIFLNEYLKANPTIVGK